MAAEVNGWMGRINFNVDAIGMEDVISYLGRMDLLPSQSMKALEKGADILVREARRVAPVREGELKRSIRKGHRKRGSRAIDGFDENGKAIYSKYAARKRWQVEVGVFYPDAPYAHLVEQGHLGPKPAPAHPYLQTAVDNVGDQVMGVITKEILDAFGSLKG